jgi:hypothetical protein
MWSTDVFEYQLMILGVNYLDSNRLTFEKQIESKKWRENIDDTKHTRRPLYEGLGHWMQTWQADYTWSTRRMDPLTFACFWIFSFFPPLSLLKFLEQREKIRENEIWRKNKTCWRKENLLTRIFQDVLLPSNWFHTNFYNEKRFIDYISLTESHELDSKPGHVVLNFS